MAINLINVGAAPDDTTGDPLRTAFQKSNANDQELYDRIHLDTVNPVATDDLANHEVGSLWVNQTSDAVFVNADNTDDAAVWFQINGNGLVTNGANVGSGADVFSVLNSTVLEFRGLNSNTPKLTINVNGDNIDFDIIDSNIDHDALNNFVLNEHIDHSSVSITGITGLTGGGDLTGSRTIRLDIDSVANATPTMADSFAFVDADDSSITRKATLAELQTLVNTDTGEINTASNLTSLLGIGVFAQKNGLDFEFRPLIAGSTKVTVVLNGNEIEIDVVEGQININNLLGILGTTKGGTGLNNYVAGDILAGNGVDSLVAVNGNTTTIRKFLSQTGDGINSALPLWSDIIMSDVADLPKNNTANRIPQSFDDEGAGYIIGSLWTNTASSPRRSYICVDATVSNATWREITGSSTNIGTVGSGAIFILDITSAGNTILVRNLAPDEESVASATTDVFDLTVDVEWDRGPTAYEGAPNVNGFTVIRTGRSGNTNYGTATISGVVTEVVATFEGSTYSVPITADAGPVIQTAVFDLIYPTTFAQLQTQLKDGDTMGVDITTDILAESVEFEASGGLANTTDATPSGTTFTATCTAASGYNADTVSQALAGRVRATSATGSIGPWFSITNTANFNDLFPTFVDNGYLNLDNPGFTAFKNIENGTQDTVVNNQNEILYSSPHADYTIANTTLYEQVKAFQCVNPLDYNDSLTNFEIRARRYANGSQATFSKVIEIADTAPLVTVTQPDARLRSGGNDGTTTQDYVITATSDQNLIGIISLTIPVGGTFQGAAFVGGPKVFTRTIRIADNDAKGIGAWTFTATPTNNAGISATITGDENLGGFVSRTLILPAFAQTVDMNVDVVDNLKLTFLWDFKPSVQTQSAVGDAVTPKADTWAMAALSPFPNTIRILDTAATDASSQASNVTIEETI